MVELIVVLILTGILGAIGAARFFSSTGFDAAAFADQSAAMLRYAQKIAIAQNRPVFVQASTQGLMLCYTASAPCGDTARVTAPSGTNSGSSATRAFCTGGGTYAPAWYCEGVPSGANITLNPSSAATFYFNGLGRPYLASDNGIDSAFTGLSLSISGDGVVRTISVAQETGYVF
jgi:MSHA pilin protein MshC